MPGGALAQGSEIFLERGRNIDTQGAGIWQRLVLGGHGEGVRMMMFWVVRVDGWAAGRDVGGTERW